MAENDGNNSVKDLKNFFATEEKPVSTSEIMEFWKSLSEQDRAYYKSAPLV